ncbi:MAG: GxxExxY protein [Proteobacteria bacterium]|nr:GxxExxY protein [Pseudomonadota bacterium]
MARGDRTDIIVAQDIVLEIRSTAHVQPLHEAQMLTCRSCCKSGLLANFNAVPPKDGVRRFSHELLACSAISGPLRPLR